MKGFWLDTEQYGNYRWRTESGVPEFDPKRPGNLKFPLGKDEDAVLRKRGRQWIEAVQKELPQELVDKAELELDYLPSVDELSSDDKDRAA